MLSELDVSQEQWRRGEVKKLLSSELRPQTAEVVGQLLAAEDIAMNTMREKLPVDVKSEVIPQGLQLVIRGVGHQVLCDSQRVEPGA